MKKINKEISIKRNKLWFTLVELIIVITILAILASISFIWFKWFITDSRDSTRLATLNSIEKWLKVFEVKSWSYPLPEKWYVSIYASWTSNMIWYQWYFWEIASKIISMEKVPLDPSDKQRYTYYVNAKQNKYQLLAMLEWDNSYSYVDRAYAEDYTKRVPITVWNNLWILLDTSNNPVQSLSLTWIDLLNTSSPYTCIFDSNKKITWTWDVLKAWLWWGWLVWYWDFDTLSWNLIFDKSSYLNNWVLTWNVLPTLTTWKVWNWILFNSWSKHFIETSLIWDSNLWWDITISLYTKTFSNANEVLLEINSNFWFSVQSHDWYYQLNTWWWNIWKNTKSSSKPYSNSNWYHVTLISRGWKWYIYINWVNDTVINTFNWIQFYNWKKLIIWSRNWDYWYNWLIDEVRIYNRALSDSEIQNLYNSTK